MDARYSIQKQYLGKDGHLRKTAYHLRMYPKEFVKKFFESISTTKLKAEKVFTAAVIIPSVILRAGPALRLKLRR